MHILRKGRNVAIEKFGPTRNALITLNSPVYGATCAGGSSPCNWTQVKSMARASDMTASGFQLTKTPTASVFWLRDLRMFQASAGAMARGDFS